MKKGREEGGVIMIVDKMNTPREMYMSGNGIEIVSV